MACGLMCCWKRRVSLRWARRAGRCCVATVSVALLAGIVTDAQAITIDTVPIGNPGNANDPADGDINSSGIQHFGSVGYNYRIGKYDVTVGQYTAFLNSVAGTDTYGLYNSLMATDLNIAGISQSCIAGSCSYSVIGSAKHPITYVSWGDAARFANWLNNGQPTGTEDAGTTETGAYTLNGAVTNAALRSVSRNVGAKWFVPSENEWYKAAYYDPVAGHYWNYATGTNATPTSVQPGNLPNSANYTGATGYAVTGSPTYDPTQNYLTDVGAYSASPSPYGTFDQSGLVTQWNESLISGFRDARGGSWNVDASILPSEFRVGFGSTFENYGVGFRMATVPEPCTAALAVIACGAILSWRFRSNPRPSRR
jgi:formylglycine-generating enzyme required for sulfatase activity